MHFRGGSADVMSDDPRPQKVPDFTDTMSGRCCDAIYLVVEVPMSDVTIVEPPVAHARIAYLGAVSPHWEVYGDYGDHVLLQEFRARVLARLVLLPRDDPQFRRNMARIVRDAERERISIEWDMGDPNYEI